MNSKSLYIIHPLSNALSGITISKTRTQVKCPVGCLQSNKRNAKAYCDLASWLELLCTPRAHRPFKRTAHFVCKFSR